VVEDFGLLVAVAVVPQLVDLVEDLEDLMQEHLQEEVE
jgi:hypothetical protein